MSESIIELQKSTGTTATINVIPDLAQSQIPRVIQRFELELTDSLGNNNSPVSSVGKTIAHALGLLDLAGDHSYAIISPEHFKAISQSGFSRTVQAGPDPLLSLETETGDFVSPEGARLKSQQLKDLINSQAINHQTLLVVYDNRRLSGSPESETAQHLKRAEELNPVVAIVTLARLRTIA